MRKLLLLLLGLLLIILLSYYCFKNKTEVIANHLLSSVEEKYTEESLEEVHVTVKGEDLNKTRILVLTGMVNSLEESNHAEKIAQNINGVYAVENKLRIKENVRTIDTTKIDTPKKLTAKDENLVTEVMTLNTPKLTILDIEEIEPKKVTATMESLIPSATLVLTDKTPPQELEEVVEKPVKEMAVTCEENVKEKLTKEKIHFAYNKALIKEGSYALLNDLVEVLKTCSQNIVYIEGHTDSLGSAKYNQWLSQKRANAVKAYFIKQGISKVKLKALGYGEAHPIATNKTVIGQKLNRRIEFKIKGIK